MVDEPLHIQGVLSDYFVLEGHIASTRSADAYNAIDKQRDQSVLLWMLRHPLALNGDAVRRFLRRLESVQNLKSTHCPISEFGVDSSGMAYALFPKLDGAPLIGTTRDPVEQERRFIGCLKVIERFHASGVVCGDLCHTSFWVDRSGEIWLIGIMGSFDAEAAATAMLPPMETMNYVAPEQRSGAGIEPASDVFALGVLGYHLFSGKFPYSTAAIYGGALNANDITPLSSYIAQPPSWADEVFSKCLAPNSADRYQSATEIIEAISASRKRVMSQRDLPARPNKGEIIARPVKGASVPQTSTSHVPSERPAAGLPATILTGRLSPVVLILALLLVFAASLAVAWKILKAPSAAATATQPVVVSVHREAASGDAAMEGAIDAVSEQKSPLTERARKLEELVGSDDPLAHEILVKTALDPNAEDLRGPAERLIVERTKRLGLGRSAEQTRQWLRTVPGDRQPPASYEPLLRATDPTLPQSARDRSLKEAGATNPKTALRLAAALALDSASPDTYQPVLAALIAEIGGQPELSQRSALALILSQAELALVFGDDVVARKSEIPDKDISWLLKALADRNDVNVRQFANLAVDRNLLSPIRRRFLTTIANRSDLSPEILSALVRASAGAISPEELGVFGRWIDPTSERLLLGILADTNDPAVLSEAFDILAGKSLTLEPSATLIAWVRQNYWSKRNEFAKVIGMLANIDIVPLELVKKEMNIFDKYVKDARLLGMLLETRNGAVTEVVLQKYASMLNLPTLLGLLENAEPSVRIQAVRSLGAFNDVGALKVIIDNYERERDERVKQVYRETFWMLEKRPR